MIGDGPGDEPGPVASPDVEWIAEVASLGARFLALQIDLVVLLGIVGLGATIVGSRSNLARDDSRAVVACVLVVSGVAGYVAGMTASPARGTLGKLALGLKVVDLRGRRIAIGRSTGRFLAWAVLLLVPFAAIGLLTAVFDRRRRGLHDLIAGTRVIRERRASRS